MNRKALIFSIFSLIYIANCLVVVHVWKFPSPIDELEHYSYIRHAVEDSSFFVDYPKRYVLSSDLSTWDDRLNYLSHPKPYYSLLALLANVDGLNPQAEISRLRLWNLTLSTTGIVILLLLGYRMFESSYSYLIYTASLTLFPSYASTGALINNDNLSLLAGGLFFTGYFLFVAGARLNFGPVLMAIGFAIASLTKLTAGIAIGVLLSCLLTVNCIFNRSILIQKHIFLLCVVISLLGLSQYFVNLLTLNEILYVDEKYLKSRIDQYESLSPLEFIYNFTGRMLQEWSATEPSSWIQRLSVYIIFTLCMVGVLKKSSNITLRSMARCAVVALGLTFCIHLFFAYGVYSRTGHYSGTDFRYYGVIWCGVAIGAGLGADFLRSSRMRFYVALPLLLTLLVSSPLFAYVPFLLLSV